MRNDARTKDAPSSGAQEMPSTYGRDESAASVDAKARAPKLEAASRQLQTAPGRGLKPVAPPFPRDHAALYDG
ncbi:MAG: hypothetical protein M1815_001862 [Lichina confinis]|nr:MAG: hypothetical protein M1815_001862 [Lichina confinis]